MVTRHFDPPPFHPDRPTLVAPVRVDPSGRAGPTRGQAFGPRWRRSSHGLFVPAGVAQTPDQRILEAAAVLPSKPLVAALTGWAALRWRGSRWLDGSLPGDMHGRPVDIGVSLLQGLRGQPGIVPCHERWDPREVEVVHGLPVTIAVRSTAFAMRYAASLWDAVATLEMAAYDDLVSVAELRAYAGDAPRHGLSAWTGIPLCREAALLADENCWSPRESWMRLVWMLWAGLPRPLMNWPVFDLQGRFVGTPDLLDVSSGTVGQYDGGLHLSTGQRHRDVVRDEAFRAVGLETFTVLAGDSADRAAQRMLAARSRALARSGSRSWTLDLPGWWTPTFTVEQRRALTAAQRERWLGHRRAA